MQPDPHPSNDAVPDPSDLAASNLSIEHGKWTHSHEEDHGGLMVFRPDSFPFPRSRGRLAFVLQGDGQGTYVPIGADDQSGSVPAQWNIEPGTSPVSLLLRIQAGDREVFWAQVLKANPAELLLRMLPPS